MDGRAYRVIAPPAAYAIGGRRYEAGADDLAAAVAYAHAERERPLCLCRPQDGGVEMYVARLPGAGDTFILKRMPHTGDQHAPDCPSYEPPAEFSGLGQVLGQAISEDPATGLTTLKLDFALSRQPGRSQIPPAGSEADSVATTGARLSLRGLLHYLWDQAELTRWHPGFAGKRHWATVRRHLLRAAQHLVTKGDALGPRLYIPEPWSLEQREAITARQRQHWQRTASAPGKPQPLALLIGEVKEIVPARYGYKAIVRHVPDQAFAIDEPLYRRLTRRFEHELALWGATDDLHMIMIATFALSAMGIPTLSELSLMLVTRQWIPVEDLPSKRLVDRLTAEGRPFIKVLRYNLGASVETACALLTDCGEQPVALHVDPVAQPKSSDGKRLCWAWRSGEESMPDLPARA